jgi:hypothetical protein
MPVTVANEPSIVDLQTLLEMKLSNYLGSPVSRLKDLADVVELMKANRTPRDFKLNSEVLYEYQQVWAGLQEEESGSGFYAASHETPPPCRPAHMPDRTIREESTKDESR